MSLDLTTRSARQYLHPRYQSISGADILKFGCEFELLQSKDRFFFVNILEVEEVIMLCSAMWIYVTVRKNILIYVTNDIDPLYDKHAESWMKFSWCLPSPVRSGITVKKINNSDKRIWRIKNRSKDLAMTITCPTKAWSVFSQIQEAP